MSSAQDTPRDRSVRRRRGILIRDRSRDPDVAAAVRNHRRIVRHPETAIEALEGCAPCPDRKTNRRNAYSCPYRHRRQGQVRRANGIRFLITCSSWWHGMVASISRSAPSRFGCRPAPHWEDLGIALGEPSQRRSGPGEVSTGPATSSCRWTRRLCPPRSTLGGRPHAVVDLALKVERVGRSSERADPRLLRGIRPGGARQRPSGGALWAFEPSYVEAVFKAFAPRSGWRARAISSSRGRCASQRGSVIALFGLRRRI